MVNFSDVPISLANAFEAPVRADKDGFLKPSIEKFSEYWQRVAKGYGLSGAVAQFSLADAPVPDNVKTKASLNELKSWIKNNGEG
jgi:CRISPR system Cascade subunit CasC